MINLLPKWYLNENRPSFYDMDAGTMLELATSMHGKMNEVIDDHNQHSENIDKIINDFLTGQEQDREIFKTALRQEFQDFIDVINLKYNSQEDRIDAKIRVFEKYADDFMEELEKAIDEALNASY